MVHVYHHTGPTIEIEVDFVSAVVTKNSIGAWVTLVLAVANNIWRPDLAQRSVDKSSVTVEVNTPCG